MPYTPSPEHLERYARLLVGYALGDGSGIKPGDVVHVNCPDSAKPLYAAVLRAVWEAGGQVIPGFRADDDDRQDLLRLRFDASTDEQLDFFPADYYRGLVDQVDHTLHIMCSHNPHALRDIAPDRVMRSQRAMRPLQQWLVAKENAGKYTWTIGLYPSEAMAAEAQMSLEEYWEQVIRACFLDDPDPAERWREVDREIQSRTGWLNSLAIERLHVEAEDADLWLTVGQKRRWLGGGGKNLPSFEVFTSPDWRGTEGSIGFSEPLYVHGSLIRGVELTFSEGRVVRASARENEPLLREMIATPNADRVGEFSLTDARLSRITKFMANTLYDENVGGPFGNTHLAIGMAIKQTYDGDPSQVSDEEWERLGFNDSVVHTDIVSTTDRTVTAVLADGSSQVIYADGQFQH